MGAVQDLRASPAWTDVLEGAPGRWSREQTRVTPVLAAPVVGEHVLVKAEGLQRTGSFKIRGAAAKIASLPDEAARRGVVTASAGNHGLGVAMAAALRNVGATVVVPETSPAVKRRGIEALGAELLVHGHGFDESARRAHDLAGERGATFLSAVDDERVLLGNGALLAEELAAQVGGLGTDDLVVVPVGGGGLASGIGAMLRDSGLTLIGVEPDSNCAMRRSLERGRALTEFPEGGETIAEGLEGAVGERCFALCRELLREVVTVSEEGMLRAMALAYRRIGLILEPSAAASLAAVLEHPAALKADRVICVATGSNVDPDLLDRALRTHG